MTTAQVNVSTEAPDFDFRSGAMLAAALTSRGITVFSMVVNPTYDPSRHGESGNPEFDWPRWSSLAPSRDHFSAYRRGDGLAMKCGRIAAIDLDFTDEKAIDAEVERMMCLGVVIIAWVRTPRGGAHIWTLGHGRAKGSVQTENGTIDYQGDGGLLYLVGSSRPKYQTVDAYAWVDTPNWALLDNATEEDIHRNGESVDAYLAGLGMSSPTTTKAAGNAVIPADLPPMPKWLTEEIADLSDEVVADRSARFHHLVAASKRAGLNESQTIAALTPWTQATGKYNGNTEREVTRCWSKLEEPDAHGGEDDICDAAEVEVDTFTLVGSDDSSLLPIEGKMAEDEFWESRDYLSYICQRAYAKTEAPYALLLASLVRVSGEIPPHLVLPDVIGSWVSLNYYGVLIDSTGGGKSSVMAMSRSLYPWEVEECGVTSGEGLVTSYVQRIKDDDGNWITTLKTNRLVVSIDESEALLAVDSRHGNTAMSHLRTLWGGGGGVGLNNKSEMEKQRIEPHTVRTAVIVGGQPVALGRVLVDEGKGTAERFVTIRLQDPNIPLQQGQMPAGHLPMRINQLPSGDSGLRAFTYDPRIEQFIIETHHSEKTGNGKTSSVISPSRFGKVTGHRILIIAKTAALFAAWDGRIQVTFDDWGLAIHFLTVASESRAWAMDRLNQAIASENKAAGRAAAHRELASEELKDKVRVGQTVEAAVEKVKNSGGRIRRTSLKAKLSIKQRQIEVEAVEVALSTGRLVLLTETDKSSRESGEIEWLELGPNA